MRYYVVSDVHGFFTLMKTALEEKGFFTDEEPHKLIVCGDLMDRGLEPKEMQSFISELMREDKVILIKGNHEDLMQSFIYEDMGSRYSHHISNGTYATALGLTDFTPIDASYRLYDFLRALDKTPFLKEIIPSMVDYYETEHYIFVHGWIPTTISGKRIDDWRNANDDLWKKARWSNGMSLYKRVNEKGKTIVCGHWNASYGHARIEKHGPEYGEDADFTPFYDKGIIALDACTALSNIVNCIVIED